jgi:hypothetical protein
MAAITKTHQLNIAFKGTRDYLHGTDILSTILSLTGPIEEISFQIHRMTSYLLSARWVDGNELIELRKSGQLGSLMTYVDRERVKRIIAVIEDPKIKVIDRVAYDESRITESAYIIHNIITQEYPKEGNFIERVVALNKSLLQQMVENWPWLFMRVDLKRMPVSPKKISIELTRSIADRSFLSTIAGDGELLGTIYFSKRTI